LDGQVKDWKARSNIGWSGQDWIPSSKNGCPGERFDGQVKYWIASSKIGCSGDFVKTLDGQVKDWMARSKFFWPGET
jgi:hypothetical protein